MKTVYVVHTYLDGLWEEFAKRADAIARYNELINLHWGGAVCVGFAEIRKAD